MTIKTVHLYDLEVWCPICKAEGEIEHEVDHQTLSWLVFNALNPEGVKQPMPLLCDGCLSDDPPPELEAILPPQVRTRKTSTH